MPFLRFSRDKRGYESVYLVHTPSRRGKPSRPRVLYWYRSPPGIRVGRPPFDEDARQRLESQNPDVTFDWATIVATPMPPPAENEQWRERRRAERVAKRAQRAEDDAEQSEASRETSEPATEFLPDVPAEPRNSSFEIDPKASADTNVSAAPAGMVPATSQPSGASQPTDRPQDPNARKRRRRGGRRRRGRPSVGANPGDVENNAPNPAERDVAGGAEAGQHVTSEDRSGASSAAADRSELIGQNEE